MRLQKQAMGYRVGVMAVSNLMTQILWFFYRILMSRLAGAEGLGVYRLAFSVYLILYAASLSGVTMASTRLGAQAQAGERGEGSAVVRVARRTFLCLFGVCAAAMLLSHRWIAEQVLHDLRTDRALLIMLLCLLLTGLENCVKSYFIGVGRVKLASFSELMELLIRIGAVTVLLSRYHGTDCGEVAALIFAGMVISEVFSALFLTVAQYRSDRHISKRESAGGLYGSFLGIALPVSLSALLSNSIASLGTIILPERLRLSGLTGGQALAELGIVSGVTLPIMLLPVSLISPLATVLMPGVTERRVRTDVYRAGLLVEKALRVTAMLALPAVAMLVPLAPTIAELFFGQTLAAEHLLLFGVVSVLSAFQMVVGSALYGIDEQRIAVALTIAGEALQLVLTWRLAAIPAFGVQGYALSLACSSLFVLLSGLLVLYRKTGRCLQVTRILAVPMVCAVTIFFWTRILRKMLFCLCGELGGLFCTIACVGALSVALNMLLGVPLKRYVQQYLLQSER